MYVILKCKRKCTACNFFQDLIIKRSVENFFEG